MSNDDLLHHSALELRALIGRRALSPVELLDACIARISSRSTRR